MVRKNKSIVMVLILILAMSFLAALPANAEAGKIGYVDLKKAFYEYEKTKSMEDELSGLTDRSQGKRTALVEEITGLRDESELLAGEAKEKKQSEIRVKLEDLQNFDRDTRQELLNKKNDMFREVIEDIQKVVEDIGKTEKYDYIIDSRNIMYAKEKYDLTDTVVKRLKK